MTGDRRRGASGDGLRPAVDWPAVLDSLEGEVLAAERTMADGRAEEIAAWGRRAYD